MLEKSHTLIVCLDVMAFLSFSLHRLSVEEIFNVNFRSQCFRRNVHFSVFVGVFFNILMLVKYVNALVRVVCHAYDDDWRLPT